MKGLIGSQQPLGTAIERAERHRNLPAALADRGLDARNCSLQRGISACGADGAAEEREARGGGACQAPPPGVVDQFEPQQVWVVLPATLFCAACAPVPDSVNCTH